MTTDKLPREPKMGKTVDQMIIELCERGFTLPYQIERVRFHDPVLKDTMEYWKRIMNNFPDAMAHDLCAMHFAREMCARREGTVFEFGMEIASGDSAAAIQALWEATQ